jgi:hypothetical protein
MDPGSSSSLPKVQAELKALKSLLTDITERCDETRQKLEAQAVVEEEHARAEAEVLSTIQDKLEGIVHSTGDFAAPQEPPNTGTTRATIEELLETSVRLHQDNLTRMRAMARGEYTGPLHPTVGDWRLVLTLILFLPQIWRTFAVISERSWRRCFHMYAVSILRGEERQNEYYSSST